MNKYVDYSQITESPGLKATQEQIARLYHRYHFARQFAEGKDVLEVACGSGIGLGYLCEVANRVVGGDIDERNLVVAQRIYSDKLKDVNFDIQWMDAHSFPFEDDSFDIVLLYEAIYYLKEPEECILEVYRVLRKDGIFIICTVNKDWDDFHPSPYTFKYFSVPQLYEALHREFSEVNLYGAFRVEIEGIRDRVVSFIKRMAVNFDLIPGSLKARAYLKRLFMGKLQPLPEEVYDGMAPYEEPVPIQKDKPNKDFKIIYAVARK